jgi:hypothetical protein
MVALSGEGKVSGSIPCVLCDQVQIKEGAIQELPLAKALAFALLWWTRKMHMSGGY